MSRPGKATAFALAGLLALSACSSGGPAGYAGVRVASVVHVGRYTQEFASPLPAGPAQAAVVEGFREGQVLWEKSENALRLAPSVRNYVTGKALTNLAGAIKAYKIRDDIPAGTDRLFRTRVTAISGHTATLTTCDDGSRFEQANPHTGKVDPLMAPTPGQGYLFETWRMVRVGGHWAIGGFSLANLPASAAEQCQPGMAGVAPVPRPDLAALFRQTAAAVRTATSVHLNGTFVADGQPLGLNLDVTRSGGLSGQVTENGASLTVLSTHGHSYLKLSAAFLKFAHLPTSICSLFCGKFLLTTPAQSRSLLNGLDMAAFEKQGALVKLGTPIRSVRFLGTVAADGKLAWLFQDEQEESTFIAAQGKPYVIRVVAGPPSKDVLNLTQWNAVRIPGPPPASQVVNLGQLKRSLSTA
jgi:hypothetical protein